MASPNIAFDSIPSSIRKPGVYVEVNSRLAVRTLPTNLRRVLIVAQQLASATAVANAITQVFDAESAATLFGRGSQAHRMVRAAIRANPYLQLFVQGISDHGSGVAATATVTYATNASSAGQTVVTIGDTAITVNISSGDTPTVVATAVVAAVNAAVNLPVTAANAAGVVTLTARNKGTVGNALKLSATITAASMTATATAFASGATDPDLTTPLAAAQQGGHEVIVVPYAASTPIGQLKTHLAFVSGPMEQRRAIGVFATTSSLSAATTLAAALNGERLTGASCPGCTTPSEELAAAYAAVIASEEDPARPLNTLTLTGIAPPPVASRYSRTEQETCLANGVTPLEVGPGEVVRIVRAVTTYTVNAQSVPDIAWLDLTTIQTMDYVAKACRERIALRFPRDKLSQRTAGRVRSELLDVLTKLEELEILESVDDNKDALIVERDSQDPNRLNAAIPADVVNGLHVFAGRIDLML